MASAASTSRSPSTATEGRDALDEQPGGARVDAEGVVYFVGKGLHEMILLLSGCGCTGENRGKIKGTNFPNNSTNRPKAYA